MLRFLLMILPMLYQYWEESPEIQALRTHVNEICLSQNEGRKAGSEGEAAVAEYVYKVFSESGADVLGGSEGDYFGIRSENGDTLMSRNVIAFVPGYDPELKNRYIVVGASMDGPGVHSMSIDGQKVDLNCNGANDNASGLAMLLELSSMVAKSSFNLKRSVIFVAFGASKNSFAGSWHFLNHSFKNDAANIDAMVDLDILGVDSDGMMAFTCGNEDLNMLISEVSSSLQPIKPKIISRECYPSDYQVFYSSEIPSVVFTSGRYPEYSGPKDNPSILDFSFMEREKEYIYNFILELANAPEGVPAFRTTERSTATSDSKVMSWTDCDVPPMFLNSPNASTFLEKWVYPYLKYPINCVRDGIQGRVMVEFIIQDDGKLTDARVTRSVDEELDEAALKVVKASPKWRPARHKGKKVACSMTIPVEFRLKKRK